MLDPRGLLTSEIMEKELNTPEKRQQMAMELNALLTNKGWIFIERVLKNKIDEFTQAILNNEELTPEEEKHMRRERKFFMLLKSIPSEWVKELMPVDTGTVSQDEDDPFDQ